MVPGGRWSTSTKALMGSVGRSLGTCVGALVWVSLVVFGRPSSKDEGGVVLSLPWSAAAVIVRWGPDGGQPRTLACRAWSSRLLLRVRWLSFHGVFGGLRGGVRVEEIDVWVSGVAMFVPGAAVMQ